MNKLAANVLLGIGLAVVLCVLVAEVAFFSFFCIIAFRLNVTHSTYIVPAIMLFLLAVGWVPLLVRRYTRRAFVFVLLVMAASFAVCDSILSMLIVTEVRPLKLPAAVAVSWIAAGLWGWAIVYLDRHKWRIGEKLGMILHGHDRQNDARARYPVVIVAAVCIVAVLACAGIWTIGREKRLDEVWRESGYRGRLTVAHRLVDYRLLIGRQEEKVCRYFGPPAKRTLAPGGAETATYWWSIGTAPPGATSYNAGQNAYLCVTMRSGKAVAASVMYLRNEAEPPSPARGF
jgi:hypothetical protein